MFGINHSHCSTDMFSGIHLSIQSKALAKTLKPFRIHKARGACAGGFGDEHWLFMYSESGMGTPNNVDELRTWLPKFFELYGSEYLFPDMEDGNYQDIPIKNRNQIVTAVNKKMDDILADVKSFTISSITSNYDKVWQGNRVVYHDKQFVKTELDQMDADKFFNDFEVEIMIGEMGMYAL